MIDVIKEAAMKAYNASNPLNIEFGTVIDSGNLTIRINQKRILSKEFFVVPHSVSKEGLNKDDALILLRIEGGARYIILDKLEEEVNNE